MARRIRVSGTFDKSREPAPRLIENHVEPRPWTATWFDSRFQPELAQIDQAHGICCTDGGDILLVYSHDVDGATPYWNLPGGGLEADETLQECLSREVAEEACANVTACRHLGCQRVDDLQHPSGPQSYYQVRLWARVKLDRWNPRHETFERRLVRPAEFLSVVSWGKALIAATILEQGLRLDS
jgi:ADP-ribose pyrophosphatase YjhB (NUDIX family)